MDAESGQDRDHQGSRCARTDITHYTDVRIFVKERKPTTTAEAAKLAHDYCQPRKQDGERSKGQNTSKPNEKCGTNTCVRCGKQGHRAKDCLAVLPRPTSTNSTVVQNRVHNKGEEKI